MISLQQHLISGGSIQDLEDKFAINAKRHKTYSNLVLFKYNQMDSPFSEQIVRECRGIILDENNNWKIVSRAFDKFFNHGEGHAANIDWSTAQVQEKVDGSLCVLYPYQNQWHIATSGTPDASGRIDKTELIFSGLFWETLKNYGELPEPIDYCFYFELTSPYNRVVCIHSDSKLTLLGARNLLTQLEISPEQALDLLKINVLRTKFFNLQSYQDIADSFANMSPLSQEGYVIVDQYFNRVKVKHPGYVALHHAKDGMTTKAFVEIARSGEVPEVIAAFPEFAPLLNDAKKRVEDLILELNNDYEKIKDISIQKDFALQAVKTKCPAALFQLRAQKVKSIRQAIAELRIESVMPLLGY